MNLKIAFVKQMVSCIYIKCCVYSILKSLYMHARMIFCADMYVHVCKIYKVTLKFCSLSDMDTTWLVVSVCQVNI